MIPIDAKIRIALIVNFPPNPSIIYCFIIDPQYIGDTQFLCMKFNHIHFFQLFILILYFIFYKIY